MQMTEELLELLWVIEATVEKQPELADLLDQVVNSPTFTAAEFPEPTSDEREPPRNEDDPEYETPVLG
jgi:hypothetical protein